MITTYTKTGEAHAVSGDACQDAVYHLQTGDLTILALADGVSACANSRIGAQTACRAGAEYVARFHDTFAGCDEKKLAYLIGDQVRYALEQQAAELGCAPESLASTLMLCCVHHSTRETLLYCLGDGGVFAVEDGGAVRLMGPVRMPGGPANTMTRNGYRAARIRRIPLPGDTGVLLCSDGLLKALAGAERCPPAAEALERGDLQALGELLEHHSFSDDISFISI